MEASYALATGMAKVDLGWWEDLGLELLGQIDLISDLVYFASIVHNKKVNGAEKGSVAIFAIVGASLQYSVWKGKRQARTGKKFQKGRLFYAGREIEDGGDLTDDEKEYMKMQAHESSTRTLWLEDFPQLILTLVIETKLKRFTAASTFSYWLGTISVITKTWFNGKNVARMKELEFKLKLNIESLTEEQRGSMAAEDKEKLLKGNKGASHLIAACLGLPLIILFFVAYFHGF